MRPSSMRTVRVLLAVLTGATVLAVAPPARACSCARRSDAEAFAVADAVFRGTVTARDDPHANDALQSSASPVTYTIAVDRVEKGDPGAAAAVTTAKSGASCGYEFVVGERYRVFAFEDAGRLTTNLCTSNERLPAGGTAAGGRTVVAPPIGPDPDPFPIAALAGGFLTLLAIAALAVRTRRTRADPPPDGPDRSR